MHIVNYCTKHYFISVIVDNFAPVIYILVQNPTLATGTETTFIILTVTILIK